MTVSRQPIVVRTLAGQWGAEVATRRRLVGFTQRQLAELCRVEQQTISKIESGQMIPLDRLKVEIARNLGTTPQALFNWPPMKELVSGQVAS